MWGWERGAEHLSVEQRQGTWKLMWDVASVTLLTGPGRAMSQASQTAVRSHRQTKRITGDKWAEEEYSSVPVPTLRGPQGSSGSSLLAEVVHTETQVKGHLVWRQGPTVGGWEPRQQSQGQIHILFMPHSILEQEGNSEREKYKTKK